MAEAKITQVNPTSFELEEYSVADENLISSIEIETLFAPQTDYIEYFVYNPNNGGQVYPPFDSPANSNDYTLEDNILVINPENDLFVNGFEEGTYNTFYNFLSVRLSSNFSQRYFISEISPDRTEVRLTSNDISTEEIIASTTEYIQERNSDEFFPDFYLNFGNNQLVIANNILLDVDSVLIKLYEPLPPQYQLKSTLWVVEQIADPIAYLVELPFEPIIVDNTIRLKGPNTNLPIKGQVNNSTEEVDFTSLISTSVTSSLQQINSFYADPSVKINVDYTEYSNFIKFSSAEKRTSNFFYKIGQIENWTDIASSGSNSTVTSVSGSTAFYENKINETIDGFDNFEYFLYYTSGSSSYPKTNTGEPYNQASSTSVLAQNWITSSLTSAESYDDNNKDWIYNSIPEYIREDSANQSYVDFSNMVGHFYDENLWIYIKDITNKWDNDNRIDSGISRDLIAQQLRDLGFNLYENQFSSFNLFSATLGLTPSGSYFPFPDMTGSLPTPSGFEYVNASITGSNEILPQDDVKKRLYKRIYNNLSYLYKKKGTVDGIRTLATIYGIPNTLLRIDEFGGKDKDNTNDWDYWFEQFNYAYSTGDTGIISSDWGVNTDWNAPDDVPESLQFRFQLPPSSSNSPASQSLWTLDAGRDVRLVLEYDTTLLDSGSFSGSIADPNNQYANLKFYPNFTGDATEFANVSLPFLNGGWWSVMVNRDAGDFELIAANKIYSGSNGSSLGFIASSSINSDDSAWFSSTNSHFPTVGGITGYTDFSGSYQEIKYYNTQISHSVFKDYVMNPQSIEGNTINSAPDELIFRAALGGELYTGSVSIHPKVTGSWDTVNSFAANSNFTITDGNFAVNREYVFMDQPAVGIKNRITDKIRQVALNLPEGAQQLSNIRSIQQDTEIDDAYTNTVNQVEVVLSPTNQINDDIINSIGYLNIGEYIGDPRQAISGSTTYPDLDALRDDYFLKYTGNYDWNDFIRLIKFFDNSLWKTIKDFIPSKVSAATGISIKQHLLERQKYPEPQTSYSEPYYTGSIGQIAGLLDGQRIFTASSDFESFPIVVPSGSDGGTLPNFVLGTNYTEFIYPGAINVTQSWNGANVTPFGFETFTQDDAREFVDGEFSGSEFIVTNGELNPGCDDIKVADSTNITFDIVHSTFNGDGQTQSPAIIQTPFSGPAPSFIAGAKILSTGDLNMWWSSTRAIVNNGASGKIYTDTYKAEYIAISKTSKNGLDLTTIIPNVKEFTILTSALAPTQTGATSVSTSTTTLTLTALLTNEYPDSYLFKVSSDASIALVSNIPPGDPAPVPNPVVIPTQNDILSVLDPYFNGDFSNSDCNAIINNVLIPRQSEIFWELDYSTNAIQAVNQQAIITASQQGGDLPKAFIQDYNYYSTPILRRNYLGAKSTSPDFNELSTAGGFGQLPVVQSEGYYFAFFNWVGGTSPEWGNNLEDRSAVNVRYYIGEDGNVIEPINDSDGINLSIVQQNFEQDSNAILSFNDKEGATSKFTNLEGTSKIFKSGQIPQPIIYTQTSSIGSDSALSNLGGGSTGSIEFVQGDQAGQVINDYTIKAYADNPAAWSNAIQPNFPSIVNNGSSITFPSDNLYTIGVNNPTSDGVTLNFEVEVHREFLQNKGVEFQWYKDGNPIVGTINVWDVANTPIFTIKLSNVSDAINGKTYQLKINSIGASPSTGITDPGPLQVTADSFFWVYQVPSPNVGPAQRHWTTNSSLVTGTLAANQIAAMPSDLTQVGLRDVYGQRQTDISGSGFNPITNAFIVQIGDEIRFGGTESQTFYIKNVSTANGDVILTLDRNLPSNLTSNGALSYYLLRRYVTDPSYLILEVDKPAGGTSTGVITPEYFYGETEEKVDSILQLLTRDNLI